MPFPTSPLAPHAATIAAIRADMNTAARAGAPGCLATVAVAIVGAWALLRVSDWHPDWWREPATLAALAAYPLALWGTWKIGFSFAAPESARAEQAWARLVDDVMPKVMASLRPGARFDPRTAAPRDYLERSRLARWALMTSGNHLRWTAHDLALECYAIDCVVRDDSASVDRHFVGLLARAPLPELDHDFHVVVKSRRTFDQQVPAPAESAAITGFGLGRRGGRAALVRRLPRLLVHVHRAPRRRARRGACGAAGSHRRARRHGRRRRAGTRRRVTLTRVCTS